MAEVLAAEKVAEGVWVIVKPFAKYAAVAALGFAACETYEHKVPWSMAAHVAAAKRDTAAAVSARDLARADAAQARENSAALQQGLDAQNAQVLALRDAGVKSSAAAMQAAADAHAAGDKLRAQAAAIGAKPPQGGDACARVLNVDAKLMETLK